MLHDGHCYIMYYMAQFGFMMSADYFRAHTQFSRNTYGLLGNYKIIVAQVLDTKIISVNDSPYYVIY